MQRTLPILGLFAIMFVGMISPAMADDDKWDDKYREIAKEFEEKRHQIENEFHDEFEEIDRQYDDAKMEIYEKIEANPDLTQSEIDRMFDELFLEFDEKRQNIESEMWELIEEIEMEFHQQLEEIDSESREYYEKEERYDDDHYDDKYYDGEYHDEFKDYAPHEKDPEWDSIEPLAKRIMEIIPMEKIQRLWEAGQLEEIIELIVSETDLTYEEAKRVVMFFEKYESQKPDDHYYPEHDYSVTNAAGYPEPYPGTADNGEILRLEQRISELEDENQILRETVAELEEKLIQLNNVVMEQVKFIYEWVLSQ
jgi:hypothetical protein